MRKLGGTNLFSLTPEKVLITDSIATATLAVSGFSRAIGATEVYGMANYFSYYGLHLVSYLLIRMSDKLVRNLALPSRFSRIFNNTSFVILFSSNALCEVLQSNGTILGSPDMTDFVVGTGALTLASWVNKYEKRQYKQLSH